ncbi:MAG: hypothetical protein RL659_1023 [Pseudomonadota bacterium]
MPWCCSILRRLLDTFVKFKATGKKYRVDCYLLYAFLVPRPPRAIWQQTNTTGIHVPYKGGGPVMIDLLGGQGVQCLLLASRCSAQGLAFRR